MNRTDFTARRVWACIARPRSRRFARVILAAGTLMGAAGCHDPAAVPTAPVTDARQLITTNAEKLVISQVYGGGGNANAPFRNDFIELFNAGGVSVNLTGMSVQYASATGTGHFAANPVVALSAITLQPGQYYLVQQASGGAIGAFLPTPDASGTINMSATGGKVALVNGSTGLACNGGSTTCSAAQRALIVDLVGYDGANFFEGAAAAPALTNTTAAIRALGGCTDTENNSADFSAGAPLPRNTATAPASCVAAPAVASVTPANAAVDVPVTADINVTFTKPVTVSGSWYGIACSASGAHASQVTGGPTTYTINPDANFAIGDNCTVTVTGSLVTDASAPGTPMSGNFISTFATVTVDPCTLPFTPAYTIQGAGPATPLASQVVSTKGVVVGDYEGASPALRGFYLQDATGDGNAATSDAIFVFNANNNNVAVGDIVRVTGTAAEFQDQTQVSATSVVACGTGTVAPASISLPVASPTALEAYEGMLVTFPQTLFVTEHFQLGRFGQVVLSSTSRLALPTNVVAPGAAAAALQAQNDLNRLIVDDATNDQNTDPIVFGRGGNPLSASNTLRGGDMATGITGVLTYTWSGNAASGNAYRLRPVNTLGGSINFVAGNERPATPASVGGTLRVAAMNLLNYFNTFSGCTNGVGGATTDCRGADNLAEFSRQSAKTVSAIAGLNADVLGIVEVENDGYGSGSAIADVVDRINAVVGAGVYAYINVDANTAQTNALGTDAIKVGLIYKPAVVTPVGQTGALNSAQFVNGGDTGPRNRPALAQAFEQANGGRVVVVVNHFKSKGSGCTVPDAGDGQGECNAVRVAAANALRDWLATDPTGTGDPDVLILGDLNAYAMEDPITTLRTAGYADLLKTYLGATAYSYAFDGQWGYLDHALASQSLVSQVSGVTEWHINADEPSVLDYNTEFKSAGQIVSLYAPDQFRVSDHDPVLVGLTLRPPFPFGGFLAPIDGGAVNQISAAQTVPIRFSLGGNRGLNIFATGYPLSRPVNCTTGEPTGVATPIASPGQSGLTYSSGSDSYHLNWKVESWTGTCREVVLRFTDGSTHTARFSIR